MTMSEDQFITRICQLGPFADRKQAREAASATLSVLGKRLMADEAHFVGQELPLFAADRLHQHARGADFSKQEFFRMLSESEKAPLGFSIEHAEAVCRVVAEALASPTLERLQRHLPDLADLFDLPEPSTNVPEPSAHYQQGSTLADGVPGSRRPLSTARPEQIGHEHSIANSDDPHADTKLSSTRGLTQEREHHTLADGKPGSRRPLNDSH